MSSNAKCLSRATGSSRVGSGRPSLDIAIGSQPSAFNRSRSPTHTGANAINPTVNEFGRLSLNGVVGNGSLGMGDIFNPNAQVHSARGSISSFDATRNMPFGQALDELQA